MGEEFLAIDSRATYDDIVTRMEFHMHQPYASTTYNNNDEIRIPILQQDIITAPFESSLVISGTCTGTGAANAAVDVLLTNNAMAFLFEDIRYELSGKEIDRTRNVGVASTIKNILSVRKDEENILKNACWFGPGKTHKTSSFTFSVPLRMLLGFAEDYKRVVMGVKQELVLLRSASNHNTVTSPGLTALNLTIKKICWRIPHVNVSDAYKLKLYKTIERDVPIHVPFRSWELHEYPAVQTNATELVWSIKTSSQVEKPRYAVLAFQTGKKNSFTSDMSKFDHCNVEDARLYLNSNYYPYENPRGDICMFYEMFAGFQYSYYGRYNTPIADFTSFKSDCPLYVIDCSKQDDSIKTGPVDVRLEIHFSEPIAANTTAYCLLIHDCHFTYTPLTGDVSKLTV